MLYIVQTDAGQELMTPDAFTKKCGWKNDPKRVRLPRKQSEPRCISEPRIQRYAPK